MTEAFSGTTEVHERHRFDEASLQRWFASHVDNRAGAGFRVSQFKGGQSNPTFLVETGDRRYVVRRKRRARCCPRPTPSIASSGS